MNDSKKKLTKRQRALLDQVAITESDFERYLQMFVRNRSTFGYSEWGHRGWKTHSYPSTVYMILKHLSHSTTIGLEATKTIDYLMIDIDNHNPSEKVPSPEFRARQVINAFAVDGLIYRSSDSGGLRILYFLDRKYRCEEVRRLAERVLLSSGITLKPGLCEIMAGGKYDRLPFGDGSVLVDSNTLEPDYNLSLAGRIAAAWNVYGGERLSLDETSVNRKDAKAHGPSEWTKGVLTSMDIGLQPEDTTGDVCYRIALYLYTAKHWLEQEITDYLINWLTDKHNGNSRSTNEGRSDDLVRRIRATVETIVHGDVKFFQFIPQRPVEPLDLDDVRFITNQFSTYKTQIQVFSLLSYVKANGREASVTLASKLRKENNNNHLPSIKNVADNQQFWICEIPSTVFKKLDGFPKDSYKKVLTSLTDAGLVKVIRGCDQQRHLCATFAVRCAFGNSGICVSSLDEGLCQLMTDRELGKRYGRSYGSKIKSARILLRDAS